ncbi:DUF817 domain-containing protein [Streptomonospora nanhaiensis]|uniref:Uncharacterized membrane protein YoaT (DUF817 family) n=1 Tax=Streptomonospora nanhaiensis TaxID=1323731 RepID=A0A853BNY0_9ACTN|nr:DUF817 domain-containing protein [Streptomonospora nanhaiensis]MBV2361957.1 DUF817 domain-containing protein [Streptomonospora nanhaiensis]MBX9386810.1 DUF817 domain-containing protein [Streptomonospora nanhaiensis]NYI96221.1 uncharacterized membrane protein YoaT (DUF817 family) [Streptomonospora nanhaiensis]
MVAEALPAGPAVRAARAADWFSPSQLLRFAWLEGLSCLFAVCLFAGLALSSVVPLPIARYDALLLYGIALTLLFWAVRLETGTEALAIAGFHVVGLVFELVKVHMGSWSYPEDALTKIAGVPLYSGFLYAAVGSYVCHAWRRLDLEFVGYRRIATAVVAAAIYANFLTHHFLPDFRVPLAAAMVAATWGVMVGFTVGSVRYRMPLAVSFVLIGFFLWVAENIATLLGAWQYPHQADVWHLVHPAKFGAWALLVTVACVLVASWRNGRRETPQG